MGNLQVEVRYNFKTYYKKKKAQIKLRLFLFINSSYLTTTRFTVLNVPLKTLAI